MINILQIPFNKIRQEDGYIEIFESLERGFNKFDIDYYLVGATARDVWMRGGVTRSFPSGLPATSISGL